MSGRFMRVLLFFDLPTISSDDRKNYRKFHKFLKDEGFFMLQESVYTKLVLNGINANLMKNKINKNLPPTGVIHTLVITEKQFSQMEILIEKKCYKTEDSLERMIVL